MADPFWKLGLGLITGIGFGFLLQKAWVTKPRAIVGAFLGRDLTAAKVMGTAAAVGSVGVWAIHGLGGAPLEPKSLQFAGILGGGALFGLGIVLYGYCPGTGVAACGEGRKDAFVGFAGMLTGAGAYVVAYPRVAPLLKSLGDEGKVSFPELTATTPALWVSGLVLISAAVFILGERASRRRHPELPLVPSERYLDRAA